MMGYGLKLAGVGIAFFLAAVLAMVIFGDIWARIGIGAAIVVVVGGLLLLAWNMDRKGRAKRAGLEDLPPV